MNENTCTALIIVRAREPDQLNEVRRLFQEYSNSLAIDLAFQNFAQELADLPGEYSPPRGFILLATINEKSAGCVALRSLGEGVCEMKRLYVRPLYRKTGLGRTLAEQAIQEARKLGYDRMRLDTIGSIMAKAVSLYRSLGFEDIPPYCDNPYPGAIFMELRLVDAARAEP